MTFLSSVSLSLSINPPNISIPLHKTPNMDRIRHEQQQPRLDKISSHKTPRPQEIERIRVIYENHRNNYESCAEVYISQDHQDRNPEGCALGEEEFDGNALIGTGVRVRVLDVAIELGEMESPDICDGVLWVQAAFIVRVASSCWRTPESAKE